MKEKTLIRLLHYTKNYKKHMSFAFLCAMLYVTFTLLSPVIIGKSIDYILGANNVNFNEIIKLVSILAVVVIMAALFQWIMNLLTNIVVQKTVEDLRVKAFDKIHKSPLSYIDSHPHGDIINRVITDIDLIQNGLLQGFTQLFTGIITIMGTLLFMISINFSIAIVVVCMTPISLFVASFIAKKSHNSFKLQSKTRGELSSYIEELIGNQKIVKAFSYEENAIENFKEINNRLYDSGVKSQLYSSLTNPSTRFVNSLVYASVGIIGSILAINGKLSIGDISCFLAYANQYTKPFNEISSVATELQTSISCARRVFDFLDEKDELEEGLNKLENITGMVEFKNISFSYNKDNPLIKNFNLVVKPGEKVAIVGPTGSGKTTIINLLMRFYNINSGEILIDNVNINSISKESLRKNVGMVLQDPWLFNGTIKENISYGVQSISHNKIVNAAKEAHINSFIEKLPNGYDTVINEDGSNISQGQKQLLSIARIIITNPSILILDEATSSIDTRTEQHIQSSINKIMKGRTSFIVAHRLSTIKEADLILVMKDGNIIEQGTHNELLKYKKFYYQLYKSQFSN